MFWPIGAASLGGWGGVRSKAGFLHLLADCYQKAPQHSPVRILAPDVLGRM